MTKPWPAHFCKVEKPKPKADIIALPKNITKIRRVNDDFTGVIYPCSVRPSDLMDEVYLMFAPTNGQMWVNLSFSTVFHTVSLGYHVAETLAKSNGKTYKYQVARRFKHIKDAVTQFNRKDILIRHYESERGYHFTVSGLETLREVRRLVSMPALTFYTSVYAYRLMGF